MDEALALYRRNYRPSPRFPEPVATICVWALAADTEPVPGPGWPEPRSYPVRQCLLVVLNEEWWHRQYAERDLDVLVART